MSSRHYLSEFDPHRKLNQPNMLPHCIECMLLSSLSCRSRQCPLLRLAGGSAACPAVVRRRRGRPHRAGILRRPAERRRTEEWHLDRYVAAKAEGGAAGQMSPEAGSLQIMPS